MNNKTPKRRVGDIGEGVAAKYLEKRGFSVLTRNYLKPWGELDIVAKRAGKLHFVEVKTVSRDARQVSRGNIRPEDNMHGAKIRRYS